MRLFLFFILILDLFSSDFKIKTDLNLYHESYNLGSTNLELSSLYPKIDLVQYNSGNDGKFRFAATGNVILNKKDDYDLYGLKDNKFILSNASYEYLFNNVAVSLGRNRVDYPLLKGSFDGGLLHWIHNSYSGKLFYFNNYKTIYPSYYKEYSDIDLLGASLSYRDDSSDGLFYLFKDKENAQTLSFYGYTQLPRDLEIGFDTIAYYSSENNQSDENIYKIYGGYVTNSFNIQLGVMNSNSGGLEKIYKYGKSQINQFTLGNMLYLPNSKNTFILGKYRTQNLYSQIVLGETTYTTESYKNLKSKELNLSLVYRFNKQYKIYGSYIIQKVDSLDEIYSDVTLATITLNMRFR